MYCKQCGKEIGENETFCRHCGASQNAAPSSQVQYQTQQNTGNKAIIVLVLGIIAIVLGFVWPIGGIVLGIIAIILGKPIRREEKYANVGYMLGLAGLIIGIVMLVITIIAAVALVNTVMGMGGLFGLGGLSSGYGDLSGLDIDADIGDLMPW